MYLCFYNIYRLRRRFRIGGIVNCDPKELWEFVFSAFLGAMLI